MVGPRFWAAGLVAAAAYGQSAADDKQLIRELLERLTHLETEVKELKSRACATDAKTAESKPTEPETRPEAARVEELTHHGGSQVGSAALAPRLNLRGYADLGFHATTSPPATNGFGLGQMDLFITSRLSDRLGVIGELVVEGNERNEVGVDLERFLLQYRHNDYFNAEVGRYHTPIGYYNTAYHHGTWFQTALGRPLLFAFEDSGGPLPVHDVGVSFLGRIPSGPLGLSYTMAIGNGRAYRRRDSEPVQVNADENNGKATTFGLTARPSRWPGLEAGASVYRDRLTPEAGPAIRQRILSAHLVYIRDRVEFLNEAVWMRHSRPSAWGPGGGTSMPAFYSQLSYRFGAWRPYFRYEYLNAAASDPAAGVVLGPNGRLRMGSAGLRYDLAEFAAVKLQWDRLVRREPGVVHQGALQLAFTF